ncbi:hypothetical protein N7530_009868 [Penicillium desertorum]|uniref:Uncharacterized protein n=1 Tax=Penicillium desertorum TaxID=1303715 RepID=A0A9W9WJE5_9EURO|nr:hypothetical protein N7530_009868 [Penicillium desertorum]
MPTSPDRYLGDDGFKSATHRADGLPRDRQRGRTIQEKGPIMTDWLKLLDTSRGVERKLD